MKLGGTNRRYSGIVVVTNIFLLLLRNVVSSVNGSNGEEDGVSFGTAGRDSPSSSRGVPFLRRRRRRRRRIRLLQQQPPDDDVKDSGVVVLPEDTMTIFNVTITLSLQYMNHTSALQLETKDNTNPVVIHFCESVLKQASGNQVRDASEEAGVIIHTTTIDSEERNDDTTTFTGEGGFHIENCNILNTVRRYDAIAGNDMVVDDNNDHKDDEDNNRYFALEITFQIPVGATTTNTTHPLSLETITSVLETGFNRGRGGRVRFRSLLRKHSEFSSLMNVETLESTNTTTTTTPTNTTTNDNPIHWTITTTTTPSSTITQPPTMTTTAGSMGKTQAPSTSSVLLVTTSPTWSSSSSFVNLEDTNVSSTPTLSPLVYPLPSSHLSSSSSSSQQPSVGTGGGSGERRPSLPPQFHTIVYTNDNEKDADDHSEKDILQLNQENDNNNNATNRSLFVATAVAGGIGMALLSFCIITCTWHHHQQNNASKLGNRRNPTNGEVAEEEDDDANGEITSPSASALPTATTTTTSTRFPYWGGGCGCGGYPWKQTHRCCRRGNNNDKESNPLAPTQEGGDRNQEHLVPKEVQLDDDHQSLANTTLGDQTAGGAFMIQQQHNNKKKHVVDLDAVQMLDSFDDNSLYTTPLSMAAAQVVAEAEAQTETQSQLLPMTTTATTTKVANQTKKPRAAAAMANEAPEDDNQEVLLAPRTNNNHMETSSTTSSTRTVASQEDSKHSAGASSSSATSMILPPSLDQSLDFEDDIVFPLSDTNTDDSSTIEEGGRQSTISNNPEEVVSVSTGSGSGGDNDHFVKSLSSMAVDSFSIHDNEKAERVSKALDKDPKNPFPEIAVAEHLINVTDTVALHISASLLKPTKEEHSTSRESSNNSKTEEDDEQDDPSEDSDDEKTEQEQIEEANSYVSTDVENNTSSVVSVSLWTSESTDLEYNNNNNNESAAALSLSPTSSMASRTIDHVADTMLLLGLPHPPETQSQSQLDASGEEEKREVEEVEEVPPSPPGSYHVGGVGDVFFPSSSPNNNSADHHQLLDNTTNTTSPTSSSWSSKKLELPAYPVGSPGLTKSSSGTQDVSSQQQPSSTGTPQPRLDDDDDDESKSSSDNNLSKMTSEKIKPYRSRFLGRPKGLTSYQREPQHFIPFHSEDKKSKLVDSSRQHQRAQDPPTWPPTSEKAESTTNMNIGALQSHDKGGVAVRRTALADTSSPAGANDGIVAPTTTMGTLDGHSQKDAMPAVESPTKDDITSTTSTFGAVLTFNDSTTTATNTTATKDDITSSLGARPRGETLLSMDEDTISVSSDSTGVSNPWLFETIEETLGPRSTIADLESVGGRSSRSDDVSSSEIRHRSNNNNNKSLKLGYVRGGGGSDIGGSNRARSAPASVVSYGSQGSSHNSREEQKTAGSDVSVLATRTLEHDLKRLELQLAVLQSETDNITASSITVSSVGGLSKTSSSIIRLPGTSAPPAAPQAIISRRKRVIVAVPPGKLGVILANRHDGKGTVVSEVRDNSSLKGMLSPGDKLVAIDGVDVTHMVVNQITAIMASKKDKERRLTILTKTTNEESKQNDVS